MHIIWRKLSSLSSQQYVIAIITAVLRNLRTKVTKPPCVCVYTESTQSSIQDHFLGLFIHIFSPFLSNKRRKKSPKNVGMSKLLHITLWVIWRCKVREKPRTMISNCMRMRTIRQEKDPKIRVRGLFHFVLQETKKKKRQKPPNQTIIHRGRLPIEKGTRHSSRHKSATERETDRQTDGAVFSLQQATGFGAVWEGKSWPILYCHYLNWLDFNTKNKANTRIIVTGPNHIFSKKFW